MASGCNGRRKHFGKGAGLSLTELMWPQTPEHELLLRRGQPPLFCDRMYVFILPATHLYQQENDSQKALFFWQLAVTLKVRDCCIAVSPVLTSKTSPKRPIR